MSARPRAAHHARNCPTARPYAARVRRLAIRAAKNSRNFSTATGPASTISRGSTSAARGASSVCAMSGGSTSTRSSLMPSPLPRRARRLPPRRAPLTARSRASAPGRARRAARRPSCAPLKAHLDPPGLDRHACGQAGKARRARRAGHRDPDPGEPRLAERGHQARAPLLLAAEGGPLPVLPQLPQERGVRRRTRDAPTRAAPNASRRISCAARARDTPNSRSTSRRVSRSRSRASSCRMASGRARSHLGLAGIG